MEPRFEVGQVVRVNKPNDSLHGKTYIVTKIDIPLPGSPQADLLAAFGWELQPIYHLTPYMTVPENFLEAVYEVEDYDESGD